MTPWIVPAMLWAAGTGTGATTQTTQGQASADWRRLATAPDRTRLRGWRSAWEQALAAARTDAAGAAAIAGDPALFDPDLTQNGATPPAGSYACRLTKLGRLGRVGAAYTVQAWTRCRIDDGEAGMRFTTASGRQAVSGVLHVDTDARAVFLGSMTLADERPMAYGRDPGRDMIGLMERIGPDRWRLVLPRPAYQSTLDVIELRSSVQGVTTAKAGNVAR